jgi:intracellular multiplication protein IcmP
MDERFPQQRAGSGEDVALTFALLLGVAVAGGMFLWYRYHPEIAAGVIAAQHGQMAFIAQFTDRYASLDRQALALDPSSVSARTLYQLSHLVGLYVRIPAAALIAALALLCLIRNAPSRFSTVHSLDSLMRVQSDVFPTIAAFVGRDLRPTLIAEGVPRPLDAALHAREWVDRYARREDGNFDEDGARHELIQQLGPMWRGADKAPALVRCLLAAFALHAAREREASARLLGDLSQALAPTKQEGPGGPDALLPVPPHIVTAADAVLRRPEFRRYLAVADGHAYTAPALMTVLCKARSRGGILAPAQFNFVKLVDRRLWYALHSLGFPAEEGAEESAMPNPRVEAAGVRDHWASECMEGRPLFVPAVEHAVLVIRDAA